MSAIPWYGAVEQVHKLRLVYTSGEHQIVRWVQQWDVEQLQRSASESKDLEAKRQTLLAGYQEAGADETHPNVVFLTQADSRHYVFPLGTWQLASDIFDTPHLTSYHAVGVYSFNTDRVEIVASQTVIAQR